MNVARIARVRYCGAGGCGFDRSARSAGQGCVQPARSFGAGRRGVRACFALEIRSGCPRGTQVSRDSSRSTSNRFASRRRRCPGFVMSLCAGSGRTVCTSRLSSAARLRVGMMTPCWNPMGTLFKPRGGVEDHDLVRLRGPVRPARASA